MLVQMHGGNKEASLICTRHFSLVERLGNEPEYMASRKVSRTVITLRSLMVSTKLLIHILHPHSVDIEVVW